jgi:hypothetical protein
MIHKQLPSLDSSKALMGEQKPQANQSFIIQAFKLKLDKHLS